MADGTPDQELNALLERLNAGQTIGPDDNGMSVLRKYAREAQMVTARINTGFHEDKELREMVSELIGKDVPDDFCLFPPIYADFGKNITIGKNVFINSGCCFQDQGGIRIGDGHRTPGGIRYHRPRSRSEKKGRESCGPDSPWEECMGRFPRDHPERCDHRGRFRGRCRRGRDEGCSPDDSGRRGAGPHDTQDRVMFRTGSSHLLRKWRTEPLCRSV